MRALSSGFAAALQSGATTLCHCWRVTRHDGVTLGFTDHDRDLSFGGTVFAAGTGLEASRVQTPIGLAIGGSDVQGALDSEGLTENDLANGLYDDASVEIWIVDWMNAANAVLMDAGTIGEVQRSEYSFVAEVRSIAHRFDEEHGRQFQRGCSADLGDARCGVDLTSPAWFSAGTVSAVQGTSALLAQLDTAFAAGFFSGGRLTVTSGAAAGTIFNIKVHDIVATGNLFSLWSGQISSVVAGDRFSAVAGCDKSPETCVAKFANLANFRGFPQMPGNDVLLSYVNSNSPVMDGGSLFR